MKRCFSKEPPPKSWGRKEKKMNLSGGSTLIFERERVSSMHSGEITANVSTLVALDREAVAIGSL